MGFNSAFKGLMRVRDNKKAEKHWGEKNNTYCKLQVTSVRV